MVVCDQSQKQCTRDKTGLLPQFKVQSSGIPSVVSLIIWNERMLRCAHVIFAADILSVK